MPKSLPAKIIVCALTMILLGGIGSIITSGSMNPWYSDLNKPPGTPPNWIFGPVWTTLYILIGISFALIWHHFPDQIGKTRLTFFFFAQLILNLAWSPFFFGAHQITAALVVIILLWIFIALTTSEFAKSSKPAASLLIPYLLWVSYATYLNAAYAFLN
ncbi:MAG: tryptophan-rich sensory protein [Akkermansiaceae bacterium]|jgi:benzodiazapine receptor